MGAKTIAVMHVLSIATLNALLAVIIRAKLDVIIRAKAHAQTGVAQAAHMIAPQFVQKIAQGDAPLHVQAVARLLVLWLAHLDVLVNALAVAQTVVHMIAQLLAQRTAQGGALAHVLVGARVRVLGVLDVLEHAQEHVLVVACLIARGLALQILCQAQLQFK